MNRAIVTMFLFAAGCAGTEGLSGAELLSQAPVVTAAPGAEGSDGFSVMEEADARVALESARAAFLREDYEQCIELVKTTLEEGPPAQIGQELRMLRFEAKRRLLTREILSGRILAVRDVYTFGEQVELDLTLRNLSPGPVEVPENEPDSSRAVFVLDVSREDWDFLGNVRTESRPQLVPLTESLEIGVAGSEAIRHVISTVPAESAIAASLS